MFFFPFCHCHRLSRVSYQQACAFCSFIYQRRGKVLLYQQSPLLICCFQDIPYLVFMPSFEPDGPLIFPVTSVHLNARCGTKSSASFDEDNLMLPTMSAEFPHERRRWKWTTCSWWSQGWSAHILAVFVHENSWKVLGINLTSSMFVPFHITNLQTMYGWSGNRHYRVKDGSWSSTLVTLAICRSI